MKRLRDKNTGEVYGWNREMAKLAYLEEFDDEEEGSGWTGPSPSDEPVTTLPTMGLAAASEDPDEAVKAAIAAAAVKSTPAPYVPPTAEQLAAMSAEEISAEMEKLDAYEAETKARANPSPADPEPASKTAKKK